MLTAMILGHTLPANGTVALLQPLTLEAAMDEPELLHCPFCGSDEISHGSAYPGYTSEHCGLVQCHGCDAAMLGAEESDAITAWNTRSALAAHQGTRDDGWKPIESAPKDGTEILLAYRAWRPSNPDTEVYVTAGQWLWSAGHEDDPPDSDHGAFWELNNDWADQWGGNLMPTHWRPYPAPPAIAARIGAGEL